MDLFSKTSSFHVMRLACYDELDPFTGLPCKDCFLKATNELLQKARNCREQSWLYVVTLRIEKFAAYQESLGITLANQLLMGVVMRLQMYLPRFSGLGPFFLARTSQNDFAFCLSSELASQQNFASFLEELEASLVTPYFVGSEAIKLSFPFGVSKFDGKLDSKSIEANNLFETAQNNLTSLYLRYN